MKVISDEVTKSGAITLMEAESMKAFISAQIENELLNIVNRPVGPDSHPASIQMDVERHKEQWKERLREVGITCIL